MFTPVDDYLHLLADEDARDVPFVVRDFNFSVGLNIPEYCGGMSERKFLRDLASFAFRLLGSCVCVAPAPNPRFWTRFTFGIIASMLLVHPHN